MTDAEELALLEQLEREIRASAEAAYEELTQRVINGEPPQKVLKEINERVIGEHKAAFAAALSEVLERSVGSQEAGNWPIGDITLSERLHANAKATALTTAEVIRQHVAAFDQAKTLAMQLYEGYDFNPTELLNPARPSKVLPKYLKRAMKDPGVRSSIVRTLSRIQASTLRTPALRAAYLQAIDDAARGAGAERLKKQLWVAYQEKMRYTANRIATTELHSAYETKKAQGIMADEQLKWVQVKMSAYHPKTDLCDYFSSVNAYGKGPGVYPKGKAPKPTYHPFCRCVIVQRFDLDQEDETKRNAAAESSYLQSLDDKVSARIQRELARAHDSKNPYRVRPLSEIVPSVASAKLASEIVAVATVLPPVSVDRFVPSKTPKEAAKWMMENDVVDFADFGKIRNMDLINDWNQALYNTVKEFPELRKNQKFTGSIQAQYARYYEFAIDRYKLQLQKAGVNPTDEQVKEWYFQYTKRKKVKPNNWAHSWTQNDVHGIALNEIAAAKGDKFINDIIRNVDNNYHPIGCESLKSVVDHEMGHQLDALLDLRGSQEIRSIMNGIDIPKEVSEYATKNTGEFIAECWAEYRNNPYPRKIATEVGELIKRKYADIAGK
jgi:hypothetical protein